MVHISAIYEEKDIYGYLLQHQILTQYQKSKNNILLGHHTGNFFVERRPKGSGIWYFRINKKYRAWGRIADNDILIVEYIDDHQ
jgi:plasmid maintenance system killer protein